MLCRCRVVSVVVYGHLVLPLRDNDWLLRWPVPSCIRQVLHLNWVGMQQPCRIPSVRLPSYRLVDSPAHGKQGIGVQHSRISLPLSSNRSTGSVEPLLGVMTRQFSAIRIDGVKFRWLTPNLD